MFNDQQKAEIAAIAKQQAMMMMTNPASLSAMSRQMVLNPSSSFTLPKVPPHTHDGVNNLKIDKQNLKGNKINTSPITFAQANVDYTIEVNFKPQNIWFYGEAVNDANSPTIRALCIGNALAGGAYYSAPKTTTSVAVGQTKQDIAQSSVYMVIDNSAGGSQTVVTSVNFSAQTYTTTSVALNAQGHVLAGYVHLVDVNWGNTIYARMTVTSVSGKGITLHVDNLASGWQIIGNLVIT